MATLPSGVVLQKVNQHVLLVGVLLLHSVSSFSVSQRSELIVFQVAMVMDGFATGILVTVDKDQGIMPHIVYS